jgi:hypothetical protein
MTGKLEWLNESAYTWGRWTAGVPHVIEQSDEVSFTATEGRDICIHEIDRSIDYHVVVSAHCVFERLSEHGF